MDFISEGTDYYEREKAGCQEQMEKCCSSVSYVTGGSTGAAAGVFQGSAGTACGPAEVETACMTGMEYEETVKKWKLRKK